MASQVLVLQTEDDHPRLLAPVFVSLSLKPEFRCPGDENKSLEIYMVRYLYELIYL